MRLAALLAAIALSATVPAVAGGSEPASRIFVLAPAGTLGAFVDVAETPAADLVLARTRHDGASVIRVPRRGPDTVVTEYRREGFMAPTGGLGVAAARDGSVLVADGLHARIERVLLDGRVEVVAGSGESGFSGDGGPGPAARLNLGSSYSDALGVAVARNGDVLFADLWNGRVRRVRTDGIVDTVAGSGLPLIPGPLAPSGDGGPAVAAQLLGPADVLPMPDGGFLVSDLSAVWRVRPDGIIVRFAGTLAATRGPGQGDGGPARSAGIGVPTGLARATGGDVLIAEAAIGRVRGVGDDGRIRKLVDLAPLARDGARVGDFAGRTPPASLQGIAVTAEGGIAMAAGHLYYRAPRDTFRTLVALRDARVSERRVAVEFDATQPGTARLQVRRRGLLVASTPARRVRAGRSTLRVAGRFAPRTHEVSVRLTGPGYATARDDVSLFTSRVLPAVGRDDELATRMREAAEGAIGDTGAIDRCRRQTARRIDCAVIDLDGDRCVAVLAFTLRPSGALFERPYVCRSRGRVFRRRPAWTDPAEALR